MTLPRLITIRQQSQRDFAKTIIDKLPENYIVEFKEPTRSNRQNKRLWAMLSDVARQHVYWGSLRPPQAWRDIFTAALRQVDVVPSLDGKGVVQIGLRTSKMSVRDMTELMMLIEAYAAEHGIELKEPEQ